MSVGGIMTESKGQFAQNPAQDCRYHGTSCQESQENQRHDF